MRERALRTCRVSAIAVCLGAVLLSRGFAGVTAAQKTSAGADSHTAARAFVDKYCVGCHSDRLQIGGITLERMTIDRVRTEADVWEKVVRKLRARAMPPPGRPRPGDEEYDGVASALERELDRHARAKLDPGRPPIHRLTRTEYGHVIRDLLALEFDGQAMLPPDDVSFGFDNIAEVLSVSSTLLERYMSAATRISQLAVGVPAVQPTIDTYTVPQLLLQDERMGSDLPFGTAGGAAIRHHFPVDGEYAIRVRLRRNLYGYIRGLGRQRRVDVRVAGTRIALATFGGTAPGTPAPAMGWTGSAFQGSPEWEDYMLHADEPLEFPFKAAAGTHVVAVAFERNPSKTEGVRQPRITGFGYDADDSGNPAVGSVIVRGPLTVAGPGDTPSRRKVLVCRPASAAAKAEADCARRILTALVRRAYRRPATAEDLRALLRFYEEGRKTDGFDGGIQQALERLLIDPEFLFRIERDPAGLAPGAVYLLSPLELASRLSFFLWSSIPDEELLDLGEKGRLTDPVVLDAQVRRMLADPRARALAINFVTQWLDLRKAQALVPDPATFPDFTENLRDAFRQETELFAESLLREDRSVVDFLNADYTFVNDFLADHYGINGVYGSHFRRVTLDGRVRRGLLGHGSVLMSTSYGNRTSPVLRGKWLLENILGSPPPPPPPDAPTLPERPAGKALSVRQRLETHRRNPVCAACHDVIDPLGFSLENFDAVGRWRALDEGGVPVDASGTLADGTRLDGPAALRSHLVRYRGSFVETFTEKLLIYAVGRGVEFTDRPAIREIVRAAEAQDFRWSAIVAGIVKSAPFQMRRTSAPQRSTP